MKNQDDFKSYLISKQETMIDEHSKAMHWHKECIRRCEEKIKNCRDSNGC